VIASPLPAHPPPLNNVKNARARLHVGWRRGTPAASGPSKKSSLNRPYFYRAPRLLFQPPSSVPTQHNPRPALLPLDNSGSSHEQERSPRFLSSDFPRQDGSWQPARQSPREEPQEAGRAEGRQQGTSACPPDGVHLMIRWGLLILILGRCQAASCPRPRRMRRLSCVLNRLPVC
jgi:hypothetical protein